MYYLVTAYGDNDDDIKGHRLLGRAMSVLDDFPVLGSDEINQILLTESGLREQVERVRITPQPLSLDDMSKLWTTFQTQYRISAAYQVSAVLIESTRPTKAPLPVLKRGEQDRGVTAQPDLIPPFPALDAIQSPNQQPSALLGDVLTISGHHLDGTSVTVEIKHPRLPDAIPLTHEPGGTATSLKRKIQNQPNDLPAGFYTLAAKIMRPGESFTRTTNELVFSLAPQIEANPPSSVVRNLGDVTVTLACKPRILPEQRAALLLGDREILAEQHSSPTTTLTFVAKTDRVPLPAGQYFVRLRVDGVDSLLVDRTVTPPIFDPNQQVTIT